MGKLRKCEDCKFLQGKEFGYSEYSVEGTARWCTVGLNPSQWWDGWWGESKESKYAAQCGGFVRGEPDIHPVECSCCSAHDNCCVTDHRD